MNNKAKYFVYAILGLASLGLFYNLFFDTVDFFKGTLMMIGFAVVFGLLIYYFFIGRHRSGQDSNYRKAVKQSRKKYGKNTNSRFTNSNKPSKLQRQKKPSHLTVIKGNKK
ncbi:hypothetical protein E3U55_03165 [Filobacillus milosensis]|uniref:Uncharacterized protein n=1 Tax=Filobacillus milosensis TaxID=94137 RepID=A0A4Y8ISR6_9BACI|nr:SA1362 family protein [Filobacillus milosensis]TFB23827.1 hypothetical protein E3U55_03165 [Filobacillus milosensis]